MTKPFPNLTAQEANERCLKTLRGLRDTAAKRDARELHEDIGRAILIIEGALKNANDA